MPEIAPAPAQSTAPSTGAASNPLAPTLIRQLRFVGFIEGISFLLLLGIAMPLKYLAGMPQAVRFVGMAHGLLWVLYVGAAVWAGISLRWPLSRTLLVLAASVLPAGPFLIDGRLRRLESGAPAK